MIFKRDSGINISEYEIHNIPTLSYEEVKLLLGGKGWNYINVWNLSLLKKAIVAASNYGFENGKRGFHEEIQRVVKEKLSKRNVEEYLNALVCFDILNNDGNFLKFQNINSFDLNKIELTSSDINAFIDIFYSYPRFKFFHNWFLGGFDNKNGLNEVTKEKVINASIPLLSFSDTEVFDKDSGKKRVFTDSFFSTESNVLYKVPFESEKESRENKILMRFWDLFVIWGIELKQMEKVNLTDAIGLTTQKKKNLYLTYFINSNSKIDLKSFISKNYPKSTKSISLSELTINLAINYRLPISSIHKEIVEQSLDSDHAFSLQRTSAVFIKGKEHIFPKLGNSFVSHIFIR